MDQSSQVEGVIKWISWANGHRGVDKLSLYVSLSQIPGEVIKWESLDPYAVELILSDFSIVDPKDFMNKPVFVVQAESGTYTILPRWGSI